MNYALVRDDGLVVNVIEYDPEADYTPPENHRMVDNPDGEAEIGGTWDGVRFGPAPAPAPTRPTFGDRLAALETEVRGIRNRTAALDVVTDDARKVRDAVAGPPS